MTLLWRNLIYPLRVGAVIAAATVLQAILDAVR